jgi:non-heme chloroperoxidase
LIGLRAALTIPTNSRSVLMSDTAVKKPLLTSLQHPGHIQIANEVSLFYRDWGAGKPLLFLSGWTLDSQMWGYQMQALADTEFRCIAYDRRGHGRSTDPGRGYDFDTLADDLAAVIEALDLSQVTLVAHSFSSGEVVRYLTRHGCNRIDRVIFVAPAAIPFLLRTEDNPDGVDRALVDQQCETVATDFEAWAERGAQDYFAGQGSQTIINATLAMMNQTSHRAMIELSRIQPTTDFRAELRAVRVPTLFIHGDCDASAPLALTSKRAVEQVPDAKLIVYEGGPHGLYFTHRHRLSADIADFAGKRGGRI